MYKRSYRPPVGIPLRSKKKDWRGIVISIVVHAAIILMIIGPLGSADFSNMDMPQGAGGPGPAGGGGGQGGAGGSREEHITYVRPPSVPAPLPAVVPPVPVPPTPIPQPIPQPKPPETPKASVNSAGGTGVQPGAGGNGAGSGGAGPGSGGGVGSGVGTGKGTSTGPGTGGGNDKSYPPTPVQIFLPPLPAPERIKPYHLIAWYEVDEKGNARLLSFNASKDNNYNKRLRDVLNALKFRPGVGMDGMAVKDTVAIEFTF